MLAQLPDNPSEEQLEVINQVIIGNNVRVEAVAGAGKTTTLLYCSRAINQQRNENSLILTYNKDLADETTLRIKGTELESHTVVKTIHSYAMFLYGARGGMFDDKRLREYLDRGPPSIDCIFTNIFIDEVQDLTDDYYRFIMHLIKPDTQIILVGDQRQCIYQYKDSDVKYFSNYQEYFTTNREWSELTLRTSYRMTPYMAKFINTHILKENIILSGNNRSKNLKIDYHRVNIFRNVDSIIHEAINEYGPENVVLMANSVKNLNPDNPLARFLTRQQNLLFYINDNTVDKNVKNNKTGLHTYHSMKGREKKCTILFGYDESYFIYADRTWPKDNPLLPNVLYVAATRSTEKLIIIQSDNNAPFRTIDVPLLPNTCRLYGYQAVMKLLILPDRPRKVTELVKHLSINKILKLSELYDVKQVSKPHKQLNYKCNINFDNLYNESVSNYYGVLIPMLVAYRSNPEKFELDIDFDLNGMYDIRERAYVLYNKPDKTMKEWMEMVVCYNSLCDNIHFYKDQIRHYEWTDEDFIEKCCSRIQEMIPTGGQFERSYVLKAKDYEGPVSIMSSLDYYTEDMIWELKCVNYISDENKIQAAAYVATNYYVNKKYIPCMLYNYRTGEMLSITMSNAQEFLLCLTS